MTSSPPGPPPPPGADPYPSPGALLRRFGLAPIKALGQHFLTDTAVLERIARAVGGGPGDPVIEIGPGLGALTSRLLGRGLHVTAVEVDRRLAAALPEALAAAGDRLRVVQADILEVDLAAVAAALGGRPAVAGNLPYNLSAPIVFHLLEATASTGPWVLMFQREVARRLAAAPGGREYGAITALVAPWRTVERVCDVGPGAFLPRPQADSAVVRMDPRPAPLLGDVGWPDYRRVVKAAFGSRRKTLRNALGAAGVPDAEAAIRQAGLDPGIRGERLGVEEFVALARTCAGRTRSAK